MVIGKHFTLLGILLLNTTLVKSQFILQTKNVKLNVNALGQAAYNTNALSFTNNNTVKPILNGLHYWVTGIANTDTFAILNNVFNAQTSWCAGPAHFTNNSYYPNWLGPVVVTSYEAKQHFLNYLNSSYVTPKNIKNWPSNLGTAGFANTLAPFIDNNLNGIYDPNFGDYPYLKGIKSAFFTSTDSFLKYLPNQTRIAIDLSTEYFILDSFKNEINIRYTLCNRGSTNYKNVRLTISLNGLIGSELDDAIATNLNTQTVSLYNSQKKDAIYDTAWPAINFTWLNTTLGASNYLSNESSNVFGMPTNTVQAFNIANGNWLSGKFMSYGGSGVDGNIQTKFLYTGFTDTSNNKNPWIDNVNVGKKTAIVSTSSLNLTPGFCKVIDAVISIIPNAPTLLNIQTKTQSLKQQYNANNWAASLKTNPKFYTYTFAIKANEWFSFKAKTPYQIYNLTGKMISQGEDCGFYTPVNSGKYIIKTIENQKTRSFSIFVY